MMATLEAPNTVATLDAATGPEFPFGIMHCTCSDIPRVTYANENMLGLLGVEEASPEWQDFLSTNIYFMLPIEERHVLKRGFERAAQTKSPVRVSHGMVNAQGTRVSLVGWLSPDLSLRGEQEYHLCYLRSESPTEAAIRQRTACLDALAGAYDTVLLFDLAAKTAEMVRARMGAVGAELCNVPMGLDRSLDYWVDGRLAAEDRERAHAFLDALVNNDGTLPESRRIEYAISHQGSMVRCLSVAIQLDRDTLLLCSRRVEECKPVGSDQLPSATLAVGSEEGVVLGGSFATTDVAAAPAELAPSAMPRVFVRTFGHFDVFVEGRPIVFGNAKEKELLAILVDRNGGTLTSEDAISLLWEDEPNDSRTRTRYRKLGMNLRITLERWGLDGLVCCDRGVRSLDKQGVVCDYYEMLAGNERYLRLFNHRYLSDYSWAEPTLAYLLATVSF